jgi:hypothetical protein
VNTGSIISAVGFCTYKGVGNFDVLEDSLRAISDLGATAAELSLYGE